MEMEEKQICFFTSYQKFEHIIELYEYDTVGVLKEEIYKKFNIPPRQQIIIGWKNNPQCDNTILNLCAEVNKLNYLEVAQGDAEYSRSREEHFCANEYKDLEIEATNSFVQKISSTIELDSTLKFHICKLSDAIKESCLAPLQNRKILFLYLHYGGDKFSSTFMENLKNPQVIDILKRNFFVIGWDIEEPNYHKALLSALNNSDGLSHLSEALGKIKKSTAFCISTIKESLMVLSCLKANISYDEFLITLRNVEEFLIMENQQEKDLEQLNKQFGNNNDMDSTKYQQLMADMLGDRDYDRFEFNQHDLLKQKIAFALFGQPTTELGDFYEEKNMKEVNRLLEIIVKNNNQISKYKDRVEISFIYNCTEPLPSEKLKRAKKFKDYNPNTDVMPVPVFILRKCHGSDEPCRLFIDHVGRIYHTWDEYLKRNKLHKCVMVLPLNGRYDVDECGNVRLETHLSPSCRTGRKILQGADIVTAAGGSASAGVVFAAVAISSLTVPPVAIAAACVTGASVGVYSIARSAFTLYDRSKHRETLSFANSEARGAYINILAGALGFVGAGANVLVTQLASRGVKIGTGARAVADIISVANIGTSGAGIINSVYDLYDQWHNENRTPSLLTIVQLTSSILFFGNSVYNFRMCSAIIEETQVRTLESYQDSLRSNRHRKTFTKIVKETLRQSNNEAQGRAEVISAIRNIQNKDDVFGVLTRANKIMNKEGIKISASGGDIVLNGVKIDFNEFAAMNKNQATSFLSSLSRSEPSLIETDSTRFIVTKVLKDFSFLDIDCVANLTNKLLNLCSGDVKTKVIGALASLFLHLTEPIRKELDRIFPNHTMSVHVLKMVIDFFAREAEKLEKQYKLWISTRDDSFYNAIFPYIDVEKFNRRVKFFESAVNMYYKGTQLTELALKELITYFHSWLANWIYKSEQDAETAESRKKHSASFPTKQVHCKLCGGHYYQPTN